MYSDSGVVTTMCGGCLRIALRSACGVSPVRTAVRISTSGRPSFASCARMPSSGASRLMRMSLDSAFSGETYTTWVWSASVPSHAIAHQFVDRGEERGQRLAGTGRRGDQHVARRAGSPATPAPARASLRQTPTRTRRRRRDGIVHARNADSRAKREGLLVIPAKAGRICQEQIGTTASWPAGQSPWKDFVFQWWRRMDVRGRHWAPACAGSDGMVRLRGAG